MLATTNPGKVREFRALLADLPVRIVGLAEVDVTPPAETGRTFAENAALKAVHAADASGLPALADDSGLEVDLLGGAPGVHSARYAGPAADDEANRRRLVRELRRRLPPGGEGEGGTPARFRCALALARPRGPVTVVEGACEGLAIAEPRGAGGFGYDPLFLLPERGLTLAELPPGEKNAISHRGRALARALPLLRALLAEAPVGLPAAWASGHTGGERDAG